MKALIEQLAVNDNGSNDGLAIVGFYNAGDFVLEHNFIFSVSGINTSIDFQNTVNAAILAYSDSHSYGMTIDDIVWPPVSVPTESEVSHSIVTGTGATGFQVSASKNAMVNYNVTIATTATIGGSSDGTVVLEIAPTNSASAGDWKEIGRFRNGQAITLALALQSVQTIGGQIGGFIPAGYYAKLRSINNAGTPTYTYNSGQEVLL